MPDSLRRDVRLLTTLLGEAIREHGGEELFDVVEKLRRATIRLHERPTPSRAAAVERLVAGLDRENAARVARATAFQKRLCNAHLCAIEVSAASE